MSINPLAAKISAPYARALYDFSVEHIHTLLQSRLGECENS